MGREITIGHFAADLNRATLACIPDSSSQTVRPHPVLPRYYSTEELRRSFVKRIFDDSAWHYDRLEGLISLGVGGWYRRKALQRAGLRVGMKTLDVAVGTGLVARQAMGIVGRSGQVIGLDPSQGMLSQVAAALPIGLIRGRAEELPFASDTFDFVSMGYALRHVADLAVTLRQFLSVLKPGGTLLMLEITAPRKGFRRALMAQHVRRLVPFVSWLLPTRRTPQSSTADQLLLQYYWDTVTHCIEPQNVVQSMKAAGFSRPQWRAELGVFSEYTAVKSAASVPA